MARPMAYTLLDKVTRPGPGLRIKDTEAFTVASLQLVYTGKRVAVVLKGQMLGSPVESTIRMIDSLTWKSGRIVKLDDWPVGIEEVWAEVTAIDAGEVSLYFCGRD